MISPDNVFEKAKRIRYLLTDIDGVLTNGMVMMSEGGEETIGFSIYDGLGLSLLKEANIPVGWISGRRSKAVIKRAADLEIEECYLGISNKIETYEKILVQHRLQDEEVAYIGDDLIDLAILRRVGLAISVPNAVDAIKSQVHWVTQKRGGEGAVREVIDLILLAQGKQRNG